MKINWKQKLTSRKFWAAVAGFIGPMLMAFGASENEAAQIVSLVIAGASVIAYIIGEGMVDAARDNSADYFEEGFDDGYDEGFEDGYNYDSPKE